MNTDRRVRRTEKLLYNALVKLLKDKPITKITVKELCEEADINRGTFYSHYADQYALLEALIETVSLNIHTFFSSTDFSGGSETAVYMQVLSVFEYVRDNSELCSVLLSNNTRFDFSDLVIRFMMEKNFFNMRECKIEQEKAAEYVCSFIATGALGMLCKWLNDGMAASNEAMAQLVLSLVNSGIENFQS